MIIRGMPDDLDNYVMAEGDLAFKLQQKGFAPAYMDYQVVYFAKTKKLLKYLQKLNPELEYNS